MSLGYCGSSKVYDQDEKDIYYLYSGENWNEPTSSKDDCYLYDGLIRINKAAFKAGKGTDYNIDDYLYDRMIGEFDFNGEPSEMGLTYEAIYDLWHGLKRTKLDVDYRNCK